MISALLRATAYVVLCNIMGLGVPLSLLHFGLSLEIVYPASILICFFAWIGLTCYTFWRE